MNEYLAELYGTGELVKEASEEVELTEENVEEYLEKSAAEAFVEAATEDDIDLNKLAEDEVAELYVPFHDEFMKQAAEELGLEYEEAPDEGEEKLAEADFLGRAMAHAYVNELSEIEKEAGPRWEKTKAAPGKAVRWVGRTGAKAGKAIGRGAKAGAKGVGRGAKAYGQAMKGARGRKWQAAAIGGTAAAAGGAGAGGYFGYKKKKASDEYAEAVEERALELLKEAGHLDLERDALALLEEQGYQVDWAE
jgi:hypothetical protein